MKKLISIIFLTLLVTACQNTNKEKTENDDVAKQQDLADVKNNDTDAYKLMKTYCFTCHAEKPGMQQHDKMVAPPMMMVQKHYKPTYSNKKDFVAAVVKWVNKPNENDIKMPGAARKFGLMPPLPIGDDKLEKIAGLLFDMQFETMKKGNMHKDSGKMKSNEKIKLSKNDKQRVQSIVNDLKAFKGGEVAVYQAMGRKIFDSAKKLMLNKEYKDEKLGTIHDFFHTVEDDMHKLMSVKTTAEGDKYINILKTKFTKFGGVIE